jgi:choline dehydrogenase-like flavoprotein
VKARTIVLSASTLESTRILLNSAALAAVNSSGVLGRYLFDQFYVKNTVQAVVPEARGGRGERNLMGGGGYIVRFRNVDKREKNFLRGYTFDFGSGGTPNARLLPLYGDALFKELEELRNTGFGMTTMGEVLPRYENYVTIDNDVKDAWGIPSLRISQKYGDNEYAMAKDAMEMGAAMCEGAGFQVIAKHSQMVPPGESIHELGTCRMGTDRKKSVLNGFNQSHEVKNLFVVDGSAFVSGGAQNPTLTLMSLSMRASEYLAERMKRGEL